MPPASWWCAWLRGPNPSPRRVSGRPTFLRGPESRGLWPKRSSVATRLGRRFSVGQAAEVCFSGTESFERLSRGVRNKQPPRSARRRVHSQYKVVSTRWTLEGLAVLAVHPGDHSREAHPEHGGTRGFGDQGQGKVVHVSHDAGAPHICVEADGVANRIATRDGA